MVSALLCTVAIATPPPQEMPVIKPGPEMQVLMHELGDWEATMTMFMGPDTEPMKMPAKESNELMPGGLWLLSKFDAGPFKGFGQFGYDPVKKKYVGSWIDSTSPHMTLMEGDYNKETGELTMINKGTDPQTKKPQTMKSVTKFHDKAHTHRTFTMYTLTGKDTWTKTFVIEYKKSKEATKASTEVKAAPEK